MPSSHVKHVIFNWSASLFVIFLVHHKLPVLVLLRIPLLLLCSPPLPLLLQVFLYLVEFLCEEVIILGLGS